LTIQTVTKTYKIDPFVQISRNVDSGTFNFKEIFNGFEKLSAVQTIFGKKADEVLSKLKVEVFPRKGFMGVSDEDGHIFASKYYLNEGDIWSVYLDAVHELVHVRQFFEGKNLFDPAFSYVERPTEIEAYRLGVIEARRIGLSEQEIFDYLEVPWVTKAEHVKLANTCNVAMDQISLSPQKSAKHGNIRKKK
jgi:hypothetical protein